MANTLRTGGERTFNAVVDDGSIVATVMNSSGLTSRGKKPIGEIRGTSAEFSYLSFVEHLTWIELLVDE